MQQTNNWRSHTLTLWTSHVMETHDLFLYHQESFVSLHFLNTYSECVFQTLDLAYTGLSDLPETFVQLSSVRHKLQLLYLNGNQFSRVPQTLAALGKKHFLYLTDWKTSNLFCNLLSKRLKIKVCEPVFLFVPLGFVMWSFTLRVAMPCYAMSPIIASFLGTRNDRGKSFQLGFNFIIQLYKPELAITWSADFFLRTPTVAQRQVPSYSYPLWSQPLSIQM
jgi:hypothetical protein